VKRAGWSEEGLVLRFEIEADAFLRGMVRGIVGTLLWVGRGKLEYGEVGFSRQESLLMIEEVREEKMESCREEG